MGAIYDNDFYDDKPLSLDEPLRFPRIGYDNVVTEANVLGSTSLAGFPADSVGNALTYELWKPSELPAALDIDAGAPVTADYVAFGAHNLSGCRITLSYSTDGSTYTPTVEGVVVRNKAGMMLFEPVTARYWRLDILGWATSPTLSLDFVNRVYAVGDYTEADDTYLGVLYLGRALQMERGIYQGHTPGEFARNDEIRPSVSEGGQWLGRTVVRKGYDTSYSFSNLRADWVRSTLAPFLDAAVTDPFFIAWRPETKADEVLLGWTQGPIVPTNSGPRDLMSVDFNVSAHGEQEPAADKFTADSVAYDVALDLAVRSTKWVFNAEGVLVEVPAGEPAYDHDPATGEPLGQLLEEQRTNLLLWSQDLSNSFWAKNELDLTTDAIASPVVGVNADLITMNTNDANHYLAASITNRVSAGEEGSQGFLVKPNGVRYISFTVGQISTQNAYVVYDLQEGVVVSQTAVGSYIIRDASIKPLADGWWDVELNFYSAIEPARIFYVSLLQSPSAGNLGLQSYPGDGVSGAYFIGAQLEVGKFKSSHIPTTSAQVTRLADDLSRDLGPELLESEFTAVAEFSINGEDNLDNTIFAINNGTQNEQLDLRYVSAATSEYIYRLRAGGASVVSELGGAKTQGYDRAAISLNQTEIKYALNGETQTMPISAYPTGLSDLDIGQRAGGSLVDQLHFARLRLIPRALTAEELQELTAP